MIIYICENGWPGASQNYLGVLGLWPWPIFHTYLHNCFNSFNSLALDGFLGGMNEMFMTAPHHFLVASHHSHSYFFTTMIYSTYIATQPSYSVSTVPMKIVEKRNANKVVNNSSTIIPIIIADVKKDKKTFSA